MSKEKMSKPTDECPVIISKYVLKNLRDAKNGRYKSYHSLGEIYKNGLGVKKDLKKAADYFEQFYKSYRSDEKVNEVDFLINLGKLHMQLKERKKAFECFLKAGIEIQNYGKTQKSKNLLLKEYTIRKLIKNTGISNLP